MKCLLFVAICLVVVLEITAKPPPPPKKRKCDDAGDCESDECCIAHDWIFFRKGECRKLAAEGKRCNHREYIIHDKFLLHCPCREGFECIPDEIKTLPHIGEVRINELCRVPTSSTVAPETEPDTEAPEPETAPPDTETEI